MNTLRDPHREAQELLPWLANDTLSGAELERVQAHVHACADCRAELASLHTLRAGAPAPLPGLDPDRAFARLLPQLDTPAPAPMPVQADSLPVHPLPVARGWRNRLAANDRAWLRAAVAIQCCAIAVLAALLWRPGVQAGDYHVLGAHPGAQTGLVVMFKPETPERELRRIVLASGARINGGPTATGAWMLATEAAPDAVVARLRAEPAVILAESLGQP